MRYVKHFVTGKSRRMAFLRWMVTSAMLLAIVLAFSLPAFAQTKYVIKDGDSVIVCMSSSNDPKVVIEEAGLQLGESDTYTTQTNDGIAEIHINRIQMITVQEGNETIVVGAYGGTVEDVLTSLDITLSELDTLSCALDSETYDGMKIQITRVAVETVEYDEVIPHGVKIYEDSSLEPGEEIVLVEGVDGLTHYTARITYENGEETKRQILTEQVVTPSTDSLILRGVDRSVKEQEYSGNLDYRQSDTSQLDPMINFYPSGASDTPESESAGYVPGTNLPYRELLYFEATAYYCEPEKPGITYTGTVARVGAIAVDPDVIPLGTKMYIVSKDNQYVYGYCVAEDTGSAIKGNIVDLYFNTYEECMAFGRRDVVIYILE